MVGCGGGAPVAETVPQEPALPPLGELPLLVPEGAGVVLVAEPSVLMDAPAVRAVVEAVVVPELLDSFARRTGVEPGEVSELVVAEYDTGYVLLARGPYPAEDVVRAAANRMTPVAAQQDEPFLRRMGHIGADLVDVVALDEHVVMVASGVPDAAASLLARAEQGSWSGGLAPALSGADVEPLVEAHGQAPLVLYVPEPLELPPGFGTSLLLARQRTLAATVVPADEATLAVTVELRGELPEGAEQNFRALVESMGQSPLGAALGISEAARTLTIQVDDESATLRAQVSSATLAAGLRVLFVAQLEELLAGERAAP